MWNNFCQDLGKRANFPEFITRSGLFLFLTDGTNNLLLILKFQMN
jgi:hypothetical protein